MVPIDAASLPRSEPTEIRKSPKIDLRKNSATATKLKNNPARIIISTIRKETATHSNTQKLHIQRTWSVTACKVFSWILYGRRGWLDNERQTNAPKQYHSPSSSLTSIQHMYSFHNYHSKYISICRHSTHLRQYHIQRFGQKCTL